MEVQNQLSYSSAQLVVNCEQRYYHYKIAKTPNDPDYVEDYEAFNIGLAFHRVLEKNKHTKNDLKTLIPLACQEFKIPDKVPLIHAMILKYLELHYKTGLTCISTEFQIIDEIFIGFVDALMLEKKKWWIVDLKTAARQDEFLLPKLVLDTQLNLYAGYAAKIAELFNLKLKDFAGARYRTTTKTSISRRKGESYVDFVSRMKGLFHLSVFLPRTSGLCQGDIHLFFVDEIPK
jgi:ATP-dependent exoDNAse (exonuclease V) beta subunit